MCNTHTPNNKQNNPLKIRESSRLVARSLSQLGLLVPPQTPPWCQRRRGQARRVGGVTSPASLPPSRRIPTGVLMAEAQPESGKPFFVPRSGKPLWINAQN